MRLLVFTTLFPNAAQPTHAVFVENRLKRLVLTGAATARVIAPVPWFPFRSERFGRYARFARVPASEEQAGLTVDHPRFLAVPRIGVSLNPFSLYRAGRRAISAWLKSGGDFDLIDAHYVYPDGVAAVLLGRRFGRPVVITARGTDLNLLPELSLPRAMIRRACRRADGLIAVSAALRERFIALGIAPEAVRVLPNGVDLALFRPMDRTAERQRLGVSGTVLLGVGNLIPLKGQDLMIRAVAALPGTTLILVGQGPEEAALKALAASLGVAERVRFLGPIPHGELPGIYNAADALLLASSREGWPNVLGEALACGTPVVSMRVGGAPELVAAPEAGVLYETRSAKALADAIRSLLANPPAREAVRTYAGRFDWQATTRGQLDLFSDILDRRRVTMGG